VRRSTDFQLCAPSRFRFPAIDSGFHLQDLNQNQFHFLPSLTLAPNRRCSAARTQSGAGTSAGSVRHSDAVTLCDWLDVGGERAEGGCGPHGLEWAETMRSACRGGSGREGFWPRSK
jgi:hypothetical protein